MTEHPDPLRDLGSFIREQRANARLSLRRLSELAGISNPYLSQIERGLRRPSAEILQQIAHGLRISAETLYVRAGILDERPPAGDLAMAILDAPALSDEQKQTLLHIYRSFVASNGGASHGGVSNGGATYGGSRDSGSRDGGSRDGGSRDGGDGPDRRPQAESPGRL